MTDEDLKNTDGTPDQDPPMEDVPEAIPDEPAVADTSKTVRKKIARFSDEHENVLVERQRYNNPPSFVDTSVFGLRRLPQDGPLATLFSSQREKFEDEIKTAWLDKTIQPSRRHFDIDSQGGFMCPKSFANNPRIKLIEEAMKKPELLEWFRSQPLFKDAFDEMYLGDMMFRRFKDVSERARMSAILIAYKIFITPEFIENMPTEILVGISSAYTDYLQKRRKEFVKQCPELIERARKKLYEAIDKEEIPVTKEKVDMVFERLSMTLADTMAMRLNDTYGVYDEDTMAVYLDANLNDAEIEHVFHHEILHALSGTTILSSDEFTNESLRIGLSYSGDKLFRWLNEALTEKLNLGVFGHEDGKFYKQSRKLFDLLSRDIDPKLFVDAYFEEYDPTAPKEERLSAWKKLKAAIDQKFGSSPNFLVKLNDFIERDGDVEGGAEDAATKYVELGDKFPEFLKAA